MSRREDGFRVADTRQVRIDALEKKLRHALSERDLARAETTQAKRLALTLGRSLEEAQHAVVAAKLQASAARNSLEAVVAETRRELEQMRARMAQELEQRTIGARVKRLAARWSKPCP